MAALARKPLRRYELHLTPRFTGRRRTAHAVAKFGGDSCRGIYAKGRKGGAGELQKRYTGRLMAITFAILFLFLGTSAASGQYSSDWRSGEQAEFEQLYEKYVKGTVSAQESARLEQLGERLQRLDQRQNAALTVVYEAGRVTQVPPEVADQLQGEVDGIYFLSFKPDATRWIALWGADGGEEWLGPKTMAAFGFKEGSAWKVAVDYITFFPGHTLEDARISFFQTMMKDLSFFHGWSIEPNPGFWESEALAYMRQKALEQ